MPVPTNVSIKLAPRETSWSSLTLQDFTAASWASLSDAKKRDIAGHFAWANQLPPTTFGDLSLGHHRASDGAVVFRGVTAALGRVNQTDISADAKRQARSHLDVHRAAFEAEAGRSESMPLSEQIVDLPPFTRAASVTTVDEQARTVELIFTTGADVVREGFFSGSWIERLLLDSKAVRLDRLNAGAPLLDGHMGYSVRNQLGAVVPDSAKLTKSEARATVKFSRRPDAEAVFQDVKDGVVRAVSVGYKVHKFEEETGADGTPTIRTATDWEPYELSLVPMGADPGARVRSGEAIVTSPCVIFTRAAEEKTMAEEKKPEETKAVDAKPEAPVLDEQKPDIVAVRAAAVEGERKRCEGIRRAVKVANLPGAFGDDLVKRGVSMADASAAIFDKLAEATDKTREEIHIEVGTDTRDKWLRGALNWLLVKGGEVELVAKAEKSTVSAYDPGEFRGMSMLDLAKVTLERAGRSIRGRNKMQLVGDAFMLRAITQTTSDFTTLLENVMHKVLQAAYGLAPDTWRAWCGQSTVSDFRAHKRYRMGQFGALDDLNEGGEFKHKAISDAESASITATTKGNIIAVTRQMIINDDMGAFTRLLSMLGRAAALSVEVDAYAELALNSGLGPSQPDGQPLFHTNRSNVGSGAATSMASLDADAQVMAAQLDPWGNEYLNLEPTVLLVPRTLWGTATQINESQYDPDTVANKAQLKPNICRGLFTVIPKTNRISGTRRYLFADPGIAPVFEVAFLEGQTSPVLETRDGWDTDGAEMRVRFDYGVAAIDYRGGVTNAGA